eukprot:gene923-1034_t
MEMQAHDAWLRSSNPKRYFALAVSDGNITIVKEMIEQLDIDVDKVLPGKKSLLHSAAESGHADIARLLLERGANINRKNVAGFDPLTKASVCASSSRMIRLLLDRGSNIHSRINTGATALILAMSCAENIALLLDMGAAINDRDEVSGEDVLADVVANGDTALSTACYIGAKESVKLLLDRGAD